MKSTRARRTAAAAFAVAAVTVATASAVQPPAAAATSCSSPYVAILPAFHQHRDMAQGLLDQPLADRDSSGISRAEMWQEMPVGDGRVQLVNVLPLPGSTKRVAASVVNTFSGAPILGKEWKTFDAGQKFKKQTISGFTTYTHVTTGKRITYKPGDGTARFRLETAGAEGQLFKHKFIACP